MFPGAVFSELGAVISSVKTVFSPTKTSRAKCYNLFAEKHNALSADSVYLCRQIN